jgi:tripartite-type tricarboxylate transporter receptor subunit TctC
MASPAHAFNTALYQRIAYDLLRDFAPVSLVTVGQYIIVVHPSLPAKNVLDLVTLARAKPGQLNYASAGTGNGTHLVGEMFNSQAGVSLVHVPYKGSGPALTELIGGQVHVMFPSLVAAVPHVKSGRLRALAVTAKNRSSALPNVPTAADSGLPGFEATTWFGVFAPIATPKEVVTRLNQELAKVMAAAEMRDKLAAEGADPLTNRPDEFTAFIKVEIAKWTKVIRDARISPE